MRGQRIQRTYDHRLRELVRSTGDVRIATDLGVPRSTGNTWLRGATRFVVSHEVLSKREVELQAEVLKLRRRIRILVSVVGLLLAMIRVVGGKLHGERLPEGGARNALLAAVERARRALPLRAVLRVLGISSSRFHAWARNQQPCRPAGQPTCPRRTSNQLTHAEVATIKELVTSPDYRHIPTSRLAVLAQRLGRVFASATTWARLVRQRGWRRPRLRVHPAKPKVGLRTERPDEAWHIDTTIVRLLDGTKAYVHAVIDNWSRRILAFRVADSFAVTNTVAVLVEAARGATTEHGGDPPMLVVDGGVENFNGRVDELVADGTLRRVLAQTEIRFSNSMIEAFWRSMKHQWLFLNTLDTVAAVRRHVSFYVNSHNTEVPHSAFRGQTPGEMYHGGGSEIPERLEQARRKARTARLEANREFSCSACSGTQAATAS